MPQSEDARVESPELSRLVREAQGGEPRSLDLLLHTMRPGLVRYFASHAARDIAEDLAQMALIRVTRAVDRLDPDRTEAYVAALARNVLRTERRRRVRDSSHCIEADPDDQPDGREPVDARLEYDELFVAVHRIIAAHLPARLAEIMRATLRGERTEDIARRQGVSPVTIRTRLVRARAVMRRELRAYVDLETDSTSGDPAPVRRRAAPQLE